MNDSTAMRIDVRTTYKTGSKMLVYLHGDKSGSLVNEDL